VVFVPQVFYIWNFKNLTIKAGGFNMIDKNSVRTKWLEKAWLTLKSKFGLDAPDKVQISFGFCASGNRKSSATGRQTLGQCTNDLIQNGDKTEKQALVSVHPVNFKSPVDVLLVMLHEMIHATGINNHRKEFSTLAAGVGFTKPWTQPHPTPELAQRLGGMLEQIGDFPEGWGDLPPSKPKQTTRMLKYECPVCSEIIRSANDKLNAICGKCESAFQKA